MEELKNDPISVTEVIRSRPVVRQFIKPTQLAAYQGLSSLIGTNVYIKHENHNPTGAFKIRGGLNLLYHTHNLAEGAGASTIMAAYKLRDRLKGKNVVLQMSGCNASPEEIQKACDRRSFQKGRPE